MTDLRSIKLIMTAAAVCVCGCSCSERGYEERPSASGTALENTVSEENDICMQECRIDLGDIISVAGGGAWLKGDEISITEGGVYVFTGSTQQGHITINTDDAVKLVFNGANIRNSDGYAVISSSDQLVIEAFGASTLTGCGGEYGSAIYSEGQTLFVGKGHLSIDGGVFSDGEIIFKSETDTSESVSLTDNGERVIGTFVYN